MKTLCRYVFWISEVSCAFIFCIFVISLLSSKSFPEGFLQRNNSSIHLYCFRSFDLISNHGQRHQAAWLAAGCFWHFALTWHSLGLISALRTFFHAWSLCSSPMPWLSWELSLTTCTSMNLPGLLAAQICSTDSSSFRNCLSIVAPVPSAASKVGHLP